MTRTVLIVEDGDEYLGSLARFVPGPRYLQAHSGAQAIELLSRESIDLVYLDMRFDRIPEADLLGDRAAASREANGDPARALRHLQANQGLYILDALRAAGHGRMPIVLSYDFSREARRFERLAAIYPGLRWVPDAVTPERIRELIFGSTQERT
jgi:hypothetical protein